MSNPWDVPPLPTRGDANDDETYAAVGRVISQWEAVEFTLARLYSVFVGRPDETEPLQKYGTPDVLRKRLQGLTDISGPYFVLKPDQALEGEFCQLLNSVRGFAARRSEIAHGIVFQIQLLTRFRDHLDPDARHSPQYAVIPPYHTIKKHNPLGIPIYAYTSTEMIKLFHRLLKLAEAIENFDNRLAPEARR